MSTDVNAAAQRLYSKFIVKSDKLEFTSEELVELINNAVTLIERDEWTISELKDELARLRQENSFLDSQISAKY